MDYKVIISERPKCKTCKELAKEWNPFQEEYECVKCIANKISDSLLEIVKKQLKLK